MKKKLQWALLISSLTGLACLQAQSNTNDDNNNTEHHHGKRLRDAWHRMENDINESRMKHHKQELQYDKNNEHARYKLKQEEKRKKHLQEKLGDNE